MRSLPEKPWHEQDVFWEDFAPVLFSRERILAAGEEAEQLVSLLDLRPGIRICDLCCGVGRHSLELARRGFKVTGVDRTGFYLKEADKNAQAGNISIEFIQQDMRNFCQSSAFDVVLNMFTSFGYFEDKDDDKRVLKNIHKSLKRNGKLLMELIGKEVLARIFRERDWRQEDGFIILEERKLGRNWDFVENNWIMLKGARRYEWRFSHRIYSAVELCDLLKECGFEPLEVYGDLNGSSYDHKAKRLVVLAQK